MIKKDLIEQLALQELTEEYFIVNININKRNVIEVVIDGDNGVNIQKCIDVSRSIENNLDRENEDFELSVTSAGLGKPFQIYRQYLKNKGAKVEVNPENGKPISGTLKNVDKDGFDLEVITMERPEKKKKKVEVLKIHRFQFENKPEVRNIISFK